MGSYVHEFHNGYDGDKQHQRARAHESQHHPEGRPHSSDQLGYTVVRYRAGKA